MHAQVIGRGTQPGKYTSPRNRTSPKVLLTKNSGEIRGPLGLSAEFDPDAACGDWEHVRYFQRGLRGIFRTESFDSFMVACMPCANEQAGVAMAGVLCDPADQACGRDWRKAGGNKACFSGMGEYSLIQVKGRTTNEVEAAKPVLFRVDVQDRNEPRSPRGTNVKGERYRIRIWVLSDAELDDPAALLELRQKIACSAESAAALDGAPGALGSEVFGVRAPDIDDGGLQNSGNHQIRPTNSTCP
jgi:hypothetical protein